MFESFWHKKLHRIELRSIFGASFWYKFLERVSPLLGFFEEVAPTTTRRITTRSIGDQFLI